ncbi:MAG TPA: tryptophan synthase subunit alpha [Candidatus Eremiobacteraceae bacterium]|jgi:tryptophan synthase alpha chain|nr:tryptophan synthase subunit alpha [Candidatus Eremiobacteraceae bacterium]
MKTVAPSVADVFARCRALGRPAFIAFLTAGFPSLPLTPDLVRAACEGGADLIELGFPYSDPLADGPIIQASSQRALENGASFGAVLDMASRCDAGVPLVAFTYYNPLYARGLARSAADLREAGFAGAIVPDLPPEEAASLADALKAQDLSLSFLVAPTTPSKRAAAIAAASTGFVYVTGRMGVTGTHVGVDRSLPGRLNELRAMTDKPLAVGFGVSTPEDVHAIAKVADGIVVGSALVEACGGAEPIAAVRELCRRLTSSL